MNDLSMPFAISIKSDSDPSKRYTVRQGQDGVVYCSCPAWKYQHKPAAQRTCKHIKKVAKALASTPS